MLFSVTDYMKFQFNYAECETKNELCNFLTKKNTADVSNQILSC